MKFKELNKGQRFKFKNRIFTKQGSYDYTDINTLNYLEMEVELANEQVSDLKDGDCFSFVNYNPNMNWIVLEVGKFIWCQHIHPTGEYSYKCLSKNDCSPIIKR